MVIYPFLNKNTLDNMDFYLTSSSNNCLVTLFNKKYNLVKIINGAVIKGRPFQVLIFSDLSPEPT